MNHGLVIMLPTEIGGYVLQPDSSVTDHPADGSILGGTPLRSPVIQGVGEIGVWPSLTYMLHIFAFLLIHRKIKVEKNCRRKYGEDWKEYRTTVTWRLLSQTKK